MKNIKLLVTVLFFANLLAGCGMTGPLYKPSAPAVKQQATQASPDMSDSDVIEASASE